MLRNRFLVAIAAIAAALVLLTADANARAGGGFSGGSRGMRTFTPPPATSTAPKSAAPMQRTIAQPGSGTVGQGAARPGGLFGGGLFGGLAAGFLGAGLFGMLFGHGFFGGMGGFASLFGLMLQVVLLVIVARLLFSWWQRRSEPAYAAAHPATGHNFSGLGGMFGGTSGGMSGGSAPAGQPLTVDKADYDAFERLLGEVQSAYSAEDLSALRNIVTPEMLSYFSEQLSENASRGVVNKISNVRLEQGDLAEAWREDGVEYATVAMRFSLVDQTVDRASGRVVGDSGPGEATELWTFMRSPSGAWLLSAIQQT